jgi:hypothetical protein
MICAAYLGERVGNTSLLVNPEAVEEIRQARKKFVSGRCGFAARSY